MVYNNDAEMYPTITKEAHAKIIIMEFFMKNLVDGLVKIAKDERVIAALGILVLAVIESRNPSE